MKKLYNMPDNLHYVLKRMGKWGKGLIPIQILSVLIDSVELFIVPILVKLVIQQIEVGNSIDGVLQLIGIYAVIVLAVYMIQGFVMNQTSWRMNFVLIRFKRELMNTMMSMDYANMENPRVLDEHEKIRNVMNNKDASIEGMMNSSVRCGKFILQMLISAVLITKLSIFLVVILCILLVLAAIPIERAKSRDKVEVWDALGPHWRRHFNLGFLTTRFNAAKEIRVFDMKDWIYRKYLGVNHDIQEKYIHSRNIWFKCHGIVAGLQLLQEVFLYVFLIYKLAQGDLSIADFTLYVSSVHIFSKAVNDFMLEFADIKKQSSEVADFRKFVDEYTVETEGFDEKAEEKVDVAFRNVSFCYEGQTKYALENVNIEIPYGQRLAIVGLNGAGKTTFIKLLCGLYQPSEGQIVVNGECTSEMEKTGLFRMFSPVFQNVEVYPFSVAENVSMKMLEDTDVSRVEECLQKCGLYEKVQNLKYKENTQVLKVLDNEGVDFSGGEKQKLAFARALYKDTPMIILDEPTAALDPLAEEKLYKDFDQLIGKKTGIYISHRLSSTRFCDVIAMFKDGKIVEYGTHEELMSLKGEYFTIYEAQAQYYKDAEVTEDE